MHVRVVRFTDVDPDRVEQLVAEIDESGGPPEGVKATGLQILLDRDQRTSVVLQFFDNAQDMADSEAVFDSMDAGDTPGSRASVDRTEMLHEIKMSSA
jgi:hypothetical protein